MERTWDCRVDCPDGYTCPSSSRNIPCSTYYALRERRIGFDERKREIWMRDSKPKKSQLKRI
jgi:hypothetical protein